MTIFAYISKLITYVYLTLVSLLGIFTLLTGILFLLLLGLLVTNPLMLAFLFDSGSDGQALSEFGPILLYCIFAILFSLPSLYVAWRSFSSVKRNEFSTKWFFMSVFAASLLVVLAGFVPSFPPDDSVGQTASGLIEPFFIFLLPSAPFVLVFFLARSLNGESNRGVIPRA